MRPVLNLLEEVTPLHELLLLELQESGEKLFEELSAYELIDLSNFFSLQLNLMKHTQQIVKSREWQISGFEKAVCVTQTIFSLCEKAYNGYIEGVSSDRLEDLRTGRLKYLVMIMDNPDLLIFTSMHLKLLLNYMHTDKEVRVPSREFGGFFRCC